MKVKLTNEKPKCRTCLFSSPVKTSCELFCDKKRNIVEQEFKCRKYKFAIEKSAEQRQHLHQLDKLDLDKIAII